MMDSTDNSSTRPYLIRALYEWCTDNGFTPFIAVLVDDSVRVPREYVKNGEIVLNISYDATSGLQLGNDFIEFKGRFGGVARDISVPIERVVAIYARENGQGMAFPIVAGASTASEENIPMQPKATGLTSITNATAPEDEEPPPTPHSSGKPTLKRVK